MNKRRIPEPQKQDFPQRVRYIRYKDVEIKVKFEKQNEKNLHTYNES